MPKGRDHTLEYILIAAGVIAAAVLIYAIGNGLYQAI